MLTYTYKYNRIIKWFQDHPITKETHPESEYHHIVPRSCNGTNSKNNIILLPTRWHYIVHCWLPAVYLEQGKQKEYESMLFAWNRLQNYRKDFRKGLQSIKVDSLIYKQLKKEYLSALSKTMSKKIGSKNNRWKTHWWKDPNDKTKSLSIKEGDPVPEGWVRGKWQIQSENTKCIINNIDGSRKYINRDLPIPDGFHIYERKIKFKVKTIGNWGKQQHNIKERKTKSGHEQQKTKCNHSSTNNHHVHVVKFNHCKWCGAIKTKTEIKCKHPEICKHMRIIPKMIQYFGFDETAIGSERFYEEYNKVKELLYNLYFKKRLPLGKITEMFNYAPGPAPFANFMKSLFGKDALRSFSEANILAWKKKKNC